MKIEYVARNYTLHDRVRDYAEERLPKVLKFLEEPVDVRVTLEVEKHRHHAELHIAHRLGIVQAKEEASDMFEALHAAVEKAEKQARRGRKKLTDRKRREGAEVNHWPVEVVDAVSLRETGGPRIIRSSNLHIKPMSIEEAALQLNGSKNEFIVFRDSGSNRVSVLYKRKDSNYGLIAPEL
jgi:putative sigma-54 modulation protein